MSKVIRSKSKLSRRYGISLWGSNKDAYNVRNYPPGQHGTSSINKKLTPFGQQLMSKQKVKSFFNMSERQFKRTYKMADKKRGESAKNFLTKLGLRLDSVLFAAGLVDTVFSALQLISHQHVFVNNKVVNVRSYVLKTGDVVTIRKRARGLIQVQKAIEEARRAPTYLEIDASNFSVKVIGMPIEASDVPCVSANIKNIVEYYSRR